MSRLFGFQIFFRDDSKRIASSGKKKIVFLIRAYEKIIAIFLIFSVLSSNYNFGLKDILQLKGMLEHIDLHSEKYGDNLVQFLSKHYGNQKQEHHQNHTEEHSDHERLPFNQQSSAQFQIVTFLHQNQFPDLKLPPVKDKTSNFIYKESRSAYQAPDFFQPPRKA